MLSQPLPTRDPSPEPTSVPAYLHPAVQKEEAILEAREVHLSLGERQVLRGVSLLVPRNQVTALIGPSGCGKSAFLRAVNRLNDLDPTSQFQGDLLLNGASIYAPEVDLPALRRRMGMVFRVPNVFSMSIYENVVYPLRIAGQNNKAILDEACERALQSAFLWDNVRSDLDRDARQLSYAEQQHLCLARAIVAEPEILLLDEPCAGLESLARGKMEHALIELRGRLTILIVTHHTRQASRIANYTAFLCGGKLIEYGPTATIFTKPALRTTEEYITGRASGCS